MEINKKIATVSSIIISALVLLTIGGSVLAIPVVAVNLGLVYLFYRINFRIKVKQHISLLCSYIILALITFSYTSELFDSGLNVLALPAWFVISFVLMLIFYLIGNVLYLIQNKISLKLFPQTTSRFKIFIREKFWAILLFVFFASLYLTLPQLRKFLEDYDRGFSYYHQQVTEFIKSGKPIDSIIDEGSGRTWLHECCSNNDFDSVKELIANGANVNKKTKGGDTPLNCAAGSGAIRIVELLLKNGAEVDSIDNSGGTPLCEAAEYGYLLTAETLISHQANVNANNGEPLNNAIWKGDFSMVRLLVKSGADVNISNRQMRPLQAAKDQSLPVIVLYLMLHGAK